MPTASRVAISTGINIAHIGQERTHVSALTHTMTCMNAGRHEKPHQFSWVVEYEKHRFYAISAIVSHA